MIDIKELKQGIETNTLSNHLIVFKVDKTNEFIPHQYAEEFCKNNGCEIAHIESLYGVPTNNLFTVEEGCNDLFLLKMDKLDDEVIHYNFDSSSTVWVICKSMTKGQRDKLSDVLVEVPKLLDWQIKDYISSICNTLSEEQVNEMFEKSGGDLFILDNELAKLTAVDGAYSSVKSQLFVNTSNKTVLDIVNAIVRRDVKAMSNLYQSIDMIDVEPFGLLTLLINNFKHIIDIQLSKNATAESVGVSGKQFWAIRKYSCGFYSKDELVSIFKLLNEMDYRIKSGLLDPKIMVDCLICKILTV